MPTTKPRLSVTLDHSTHEVLRRLAAAQKRSTGAIIREVLQGIEPVLARVAHALETVEAHRAAVRWQHRDAVERFAEEAAEAEQEAAAMLRHMLSQLDMFAGTAPPTGADVVPVAAAKKGRQPPLTNRGVRLEAGGGSGRKRRGPK